MPNLRNLARHLAAGAESSTGSARGTGTSAGSTAGNFKGCAHLGSPLLGRYPGVFILSAVAPYGCLLLSEESDVAGGLRTGATRPARSGSTEFGVGRGAVGGRRRNARGGAESVDGRRTACVLDVHARLGEVRRHGILKLHGENTGRSRSRARMSVGVGLVQGASHTLGLQHGGGREGGGRLLNVASRGGRWWWWCLRSETKGGSGSIPGTARSWAGLP